MANIIFKTLFLSKKIVVAIGLCCAVLSVGQWKLHNLLAVIKSVIYTAYSLGTLMAVFFYFLLNFFFQLKFIHFVIK